MDQTELRVYGIRHHGPGSARALESSLAAFEPDCILVEGPPDANQMIPWLGHEGLVMPVALLVYRPDEPRQGVYYPFAEFSPEYRAIRHALANRLNTEFMDLPRTHTLAVNFAAATPDAALFRELATAAGFDQYESWWNATVEQRRSGDELFAAVLELANEMRRSEDRPPAGEAEHPAAVLARQREAAMRQIIRRASESGYRRIAAVCGAWHAPALLGALSSDPKDDETLLQNLPSVEVEATLIPWTYGRLAQTSGYGAGIASPGWYDHLWVAGEAGLSPIEMSAHWLSRVAALLRDEGFDTSPGHVIEAVRLAEALAALRDRPFPALPELEEAIRCAMCGGQEEPLALVRRRLVIGERMGVVPPNVPAIPLQRDLAVQQRRLDLRPEPEASPLHLDLRRERDLERSRLLHRLQLMDIPWGTTIQPRGRDTGTYAELWQLQWSPDLSLRIISAAVWGNTVRDAAAAKVADMAAGLSELPELTNLIDRVVMADLPEAMPAILARLEELSALSRDVPHLLGTLPPLAHVLRYGGLRQTAAHLPLLRQVFDHLLTRAALAMPQACVSLDDTAAAEMIERLSAADSAVRLVRNDTIIDRWEGALALLAVRPAIHASVAGRATRLLHDSGAMRAEGVIERLELALSPEGSPVAARYGADWLDGFLRDSGLLLLHDRPLWTAVDNWIGGLDEDRFRRVLPLLRRTFAAYPEGVRRQFHERLREGGGHEPAVSVGDLVPVDPQRAASTLPVIGRLLGLSRLTPEADR